MKIYYSLWVAAAFILALHSTPLAAQPAPAGQSAAGAPRGSLVEDTAARKLLEAGDARLEADEPTKAVEVWQSVIERYPRSKIRFVAHMRLGVYLLEKERAYDRARVHFEAAAHEDNRDEEMRAEATLKFGVCFYEAGNFGKSFQIMRDVIEKFPVSPQVNLAYYYIGLGHFQLGHYSRAIDALEKVGTALSADDSKTEKVEAGKRLFLKIEDADLAALESGQTVKVVCKTTQGDEEIVECFAVGRNVRVVLGSLITSLGKPKKGNGILEVRGDDKVEVTYVDSHTADRKFNEPRLRTIEVVGNALVAVTDGAFNETLKGVVLGRTVNLQVTDFDRDLTDGADKLTAVVEVLREKSPDEIESEAAEAATKTVAAGQELAPGEEPKIDRFKVIDRLQLTLVEAKLDPNRSRLPSSPMSPDAADMPMTGPAPEPRPEGETGGTPAPMQTVDDGTIHSGVFRVTFELAKSETSDPKNSILEALPSDKVRITYQDERNMTDGPAVVIAEAKTIEGNLGGVRVTRADISDLELRIQTQLKTASALTNIGNRYKEFGLKKNADGKYAEALKVCEEISDDARKLGGRLLEETYVQLWQIYFEMDKLELAATMCQRLQREFPNSGFVDDALLQLADVTRKQGDLQRAIGIYARLVNMPTSQLRGEAQFGIAECYEAMAQAASGPQGAQLFDRSFQEYKKVYDQFPESGRVGEAVAKMANYYYQQKDYARAVDIFDSVLSQHPDAKFLDVILFNYGRCLYRMDRKGEARKQFDQLISEFPESPLAADAKKISEALSRSGF